MVRAGRVVRSPRGNNVYPVLRLDVELWRADGKRLGLLARLRDLLPGRYAFGLTGRGPGRRASRAGRVSSPRLRLADGRRAAQRAVDVRVHDPWSGA